MKVATFNINGVNGRLANLLDWLAEAEPDVVALQEIKCTDAAFPHAALEAAGYGAVWRGTGSAPRGRDPRPRRRAGADPARAARRP